MERRRRCGDLILFPICAGHQAATMLSPDQCRTSLSLGGPRRVQSPPQNEWIEREHQYRICRARQSHHPTVRLKTDPAHVGTSAVHIGVGRSPVLVARRFAYHFVRPHESLRIRLSEPIQRKGKQRPRQYKKMTPAMAAGITSRRWSVMVPVSTRDGTDQLSVVLKAKWGEKKEGEWKSSCLMTA